MTDAVSADLVNMVQSIFWHKETVFDEELPVSAEAGHAVHVQLFTESTTLINNGDTFIQTDGPISGEENATLLNDKIKIFNLRKEINKLKAEIKEKTEAQIESLSLREEIKRLKKELGDGVIKQLKTKIKKFCLYVDENH